MDLGRFQAIYTWEWGHRLLGRLIGFAFAIPLVFFWGTGRLPAGLKPKLVGILALGALQGAVGWWMVASGLSGRVEVAQERLAIHLLLASLTLAAIVWLAVGLERATRERNACRAGCMSLAGCPAGAGLRADRSRRACRGLARRAHLQHLAADGRALRPAARASAAAVAVVGEPRRQHHHGAIRSSHDRLLRACCSRSRR